MTAQKTKTGQGNIFIGGFMCSGKTSVGMELARRLGRTFTDTDRVIERRAGMTVPEIFSALGEPAFRKHEFEAVAGALDEGGQVVSLGGGALVNEELRAMILSRATLVILDVQPETVLSRAEKEKGARPLLDGSNVRALMTKRRPAYAQCHIRVVTDTHSISSVADRVLEGLYGTPAVLWQPEVSRTAATDTDRTLAPAGRPSSPSWRPGPSLQIRPR